MVEVIVVVVEVVVAALSVVVVENFCFRTRLYLCIFYMGTSVCTKASAHVQRVKR